MGRNEPEYDLLLAIGDLACGSLTLDELFTSLSETFAKHFNLSRGAFFLYGKESNDVHLRFSWGISETLAHMVDQFLTVNFLRECTFPRKSFIADHTELVMPSATPTGVEIQDNRSYIFVPLLVGDDSHGVALFLYEDLAATSEHHLLFFNLLGRLTAVAIDRALQIQQLRARQERLQTLSRRLAQVQEDERRHIARELHDEVGQALTGLKLVLEMSQRLPADSAKEYIDKAKGIVNQLLSQVRTVSLNLRPTMLDDIGLLSALLWQFDNFTSQTGVHVVFKHKGIEGRFEAEVETAAYRIVQEALTNVARHSGAKEVIVLIWADRDVICIQVEDRGIGFDPKSLRGGHATGGLAGMHERANALGGKLILVSSPEDGTVLLARLPITGTQYKEAERKNFA